ncbi:cell filamentation protein Fic [Lysobacter arseniciresistens ZS79]|uniref:Cell filamentation protein Fic n=1 Tax=Lysobacter arseniciresistens ZS79 TaxID=913325 RepID=A0A0A0F3W5_9GAMM|nr:Fic family protein [Lysobacter arseniciresistens]KGM57048.1 cell filamentation protein Fic [Lysobacter arseniciresistens ZS79]
MPAYQLPFQLTHRMTALVAEIAERLGAWKAANRGALVPALRRSNRIRTLQASLAIEQNTLSVEQVTAVLAGKPVLGSPKEIHEVRNAFAAYEAMEHWQPYRLDDLLQAHGLLMAGLVDHPGALRGGDVGIWRGDRLLHMAPPAGQVPRLVNDLLGWLRATDAHPLVASAAFHYDFEFIHPFSDGNGRMGRLWQTLVLSRWQPMLAWLPVETVIRHRQQDYYAQLAQADARSDCTGFIEFMLQAIADSLDEAIASEVSVETTAEVSVEKPPGTAERVLALLRRQPELTLAEVARGLGCSARTVERAAARLQADGRLRYVGPKKGGHWEVL